MTLKWKPDWVLGCYSSAGLEVGSVSSGLRLQDLQIKGKAEKGKSMCAEALYLWICSQAHGIILSVERIMRELQTMYGSSDFLDSQVPCGCFSALLCCHWASGVSSAGATAGPAVSAHLSLLRLFSLCPSALPCCLKRFSEQHR